MPMPALGGDSAYAETVELHQGDAIAGGLRIEYGDRYPVGDSDTEMSSSPYEEMFDQLLNETLYLVRHVLQADKPRSPPTYWEEVLATLRANTDDDLARHALVVDLADTLLDPLEHVTAHPKRQLKRIRDQQRVQFVQEVDTHCLVDLARRPGSTLPEKAGPKQRVLAVIRKETTDLLENRVARHCCELLRRAAGRYLRAHRHIAGSARKAKVAALQKSCKRLPRNSAFSEVGRLLSPCRQPNYVLLKNVQYGQIWQGYTKLVRNEELREALWRWPRRLWADRVRVYVADTVLDWAGHSGHALCIRMADRLVQAMPVHYFGTSLAPDVMPGPFVVGPSPSDTGTLYIVDGVHANAIDVRFTESSLLCADLLALWVKGGTARVLPIYATWPSPYEGFGWHEGDRARIGDDVLDSVALFNKQARHTTAVGALVVHALQDLQSTASHTTTRAGYTCWQIGLSPDLTAWPLNATNRFAPLNSLTRN